MTPQDATSLWKQLIGFADYGFNKAHSVSYSILTYACAWLKANHPKEFFCALMSVRSNSMQTKDWSAKAPQYLSEARALGVPVHGPNINESKIGFRIEGDAIYFGFEAINNVGRTAARSIMAARKKGKFSTVLDFLERINRTKVNRKVVVALICAGAFDRMGYARSILLESLDELYDYFKTKEAYEAYGIKLATYEVKSVEINKLIEERNLLREVLRKSKLKRKPGRSPYSSETERLLELEAMKLRKINPPKEMVPPEKIKIQRSKTISISVNELIEQANYIGCFVSTHPAGILFPDAHKIMTVEHENRVPIAGRVSSIRKYQPAGRPAMAFLELADDSGLINVTIFSTTYARLEQSNSIPEPGDMVRVFGRGQLRNNEMNLIAEQIQIYRGNNE